jgi:hypothetical protein
MTMSKKFSLMIFSVILIVGVLQQAAFSSDTFSYDQAAMSGAKPWTSEKFSNNPGNFQFAIIGDRTGGANAQGTFELIHGKRKGAEN